MAGVGTNARRKEGPDKLLGTAKYVDDLAVPGALHGVTLRSEIPRGRIKKLRFDPSFPWKEFTVVTAEDIPGENAVRLILDDQPLLADGRVNHAMEPIALVAHEDRARAYEALGHVSVDYAPETPVLSMEQSLAKKQVIYGTDNVMKKYLIKRGDALKGLREADVVVSGVYRVPAQEQAYIENQGMLAYEDKDGVLVIKGSLQCPFYVLKALRGILGRGDDKIRVVQTTTGGAFGGKEEYPNMIAGHAALLALKSGRPVKMIYDRHEDMAATTKRHPAIIRIKTGLTKKGKIVAQDIDVVMDAGAYVTLSPVVLSRGVLHASGPYECPNSRLRARCVATNTPPSGAFRGFGAPQTLFAAELHWERISEALKIDALTLRRRNLFREGSVMATGQVLRESVSASAVLEKTVKQTRYEAKRKAYDAWNRDKAKRTWKGIGLALVHHGPGFTGTGEVFLASKAAVALLPDGRARVEVANTEMGQGAETTLCQIVADTLGLPYDLVDAAPPDTHAVPDSGPTVASRTCMLVGGLLRDAALKLKEAAGNPATQAGWAAAAKRLAGQSGAFRCTAEYRKPPDIHFDEKTYQGDAYAVYGYAAAVVDLEVDRLTYEVRVKKFTTAVDVGKAIHPVIVEGQIMGGTAQGLGYGLCENPVYANGRLLNAQLTNYIIPTSADSPEMEVILVENPYSRGPFGAKGVGEIPLNAPAPAAAAAVRHAAGVLIPDLPVLPEKICAARNKR